MSPGRHSEIMLACTDEKQNKTTTTATATTRTKSNLLFQMEEVIIDFEPNAMTMAWDVDSGYPAWHIPLGSGWIDIFIVINKSKF